MAALWGAEGHAGPLSPRTNDGARECVDQINRTEVAPTSGAYTGIRRVARLRYTLLLRERVLFIQHTNRRRAAAGRAPGGLDRGTYILRSEYMSKKCDMRHPSTQRGPGRRREKISGFLSDLYQYLSGDRRGRLEDCETRRDTCVLCCTATPRRTRVRVAPRRESPADAGARGRRAAAGPDRSRAGLGAPSRRLARAFPRRPPAPRRATRRTRRSEPSGCRMMCEGRGRRHASEMFISLWLPRKANYTDATNVHDTRHKWRACTLRPGVELWKRREKRRSSRSGPAAYAPKTADR